MIRFFNSRGVQDGLEAEEMANEGNKTRSIRIGQMSDLHLGYRQYGKFERALDFFEGAKAAAELLISQQPDIILIPGDIYHRERPYPLENLHVLQVFCLFRDAGIPVCVVRGNHDANFAWSQRHGGDVLHILHSLGLARYIEDSVEDIDLGSGDAVRIWGLGYHGNEITLKLDRLLRQNESLLSDNEIPNVLLLHDYLSNMMSSSTLDEHVLKNYGFDFIALGHSHNWWVNKAQTICCTGSTEHVRSDEWVDPNRSVAVVTLTKRKKGWKSAVERFTYSVRAKKGIRLDLGVTTAEDAIRAVKDSLEEVNEQDVIINIQVRGVLSDTQQTLDLSSAVQVADKAFHVLLTTEMEYSDIPIAEEVTHQDLMERLFTQTLGVPEQECAVWVSLAEDMKELLTEPIDSKGDAVILDLIYQFVSPESSKHEERGRP